MAKIEIPKLPSVLREYLGGATVIPSSQPEVRIPDSGTRITLLNIDWSKVPDFRKKKESH